MCDWCEDGKIIIDEYLTYRSVEICIDKNLLKIRLDDGFRDETTDKIINFCPICGRPLAEPKPLTLEQLKQRNTPVWVPVGDDMGYWCLCNDGMIMPPSGRVFIAKDRPNWTFYDHEPHEVK